MPREPSACSWLRRKLDQRAYETVKNAPVDTRFREHGGSLVWVVNKDKAAWNREKETAIAIARREVNDMSDKIYTLDEIRSIANPIARRYNIAGLYLFGSYARGEATAQSDLDFRVDRGKMTDFLELGGLYSDLEAGFAQKKLDVLTTQMLSPAFLEQIKPEEVLIYAS